MGYRPQHISLQPNEVDATYQLRLDLFVALAPGLEQLPDHLPDLPSRVHGAHRVLRYSRWTSRNRNFVHAVVVPDGQAIAVESDATGNVLILPSRRIRLFPRVDLPQPDSPARPMISLSAIEKVAPSRALTSPANVR